MKIQAIHAEEILDSRSNPTVATTVILTDGSIGWAAVPSGASTGIHEAHELRDGDQKRYKGLGVLHAVEHVNDEISNVVIGMDAEDQGRIDQAMIEADGSSQKSNLGANALLSVSLATARAEAVSEKKELLEYLTKFNPQFEDIYTMPLPQMNIMNGGKHASWATDIQEYMIFPIGAASIAHAIQMCSEVYHSLKEILQKKNYPTTVGDEGGFAPPVKNNDEPFALLSAAVTDAGYHVGKDIAFGIDAASSEFYQDGIYHLSKEQKKITSSELAEFYEDLIHEYPIISVEDIFQQDDFNAFSQFTTKKGNTMQIVGDDLYATNPQRLQKGIDMKATNAIIIKVNQIGTLTETIAAIQLAQKNTVRPIISHRSGETEDTFIADLAVAMGCGQIKSGAPARSERVGKYNRLLHIENILGEKAKLGKFPFSK